MNDGCRSFTCFSSVALAAYSTLTPTSSPLPSDAVAVEHVASIVMLVPDTEGHAEVLEDIEQVSLLEVQITGADDEGSISSCSVPH